MGAELKLCVIWGRIGESSPQLLYLFTSLSQRAGEKSKSQKSAERACRRHLALTWMPMLGVWVVGSVDFTSFLGSSQDRRWYSPWAKEITFNHFMKMPEDSATFLEDSVMFQPNCWRWQSKATEVPPTSSVLLKGGATVSVRKWHVSHFWRLGWDL